MCVFFSVADPGCLSRILDPDFYPSRIPDLGSRIPDPKTATKDRGEKKFSVKPYFVATNFTKLHIVLFLIFDMLKKNIWPNFPRIIEVFTQKIVTKPSIIWVTDPGSEVRDPRSGIRDPEKTYSGSRIQGPKRHRSRIPDLGSGSATLVFLVLYELLCVAERLLHW
jgi:hypothetical protein